MSRSNPTSQVEHPCKRWFEWDGSKGLVKYYDKVKEESVHIALPFTFIVLDELNAVKGYNKRLATSFISNEVRDTRSEALVVKGYRDGMSSIAMSGFYSDLRDRMESNKIHFMMNVYMAFKANKDSSLELGCIQLKGVGVGAWFEFRKTNREAVQKQAVKITAFNDGKTGDVAWKAPVFEIQEIKPETDTMAQDLDKRLQTYLESYFKRTATSQAATAASPAPAAQPAAQAGAPVDDDPNQLPADDDVPF